jgi:hypothetical protein
MRKFDIDQLFGIQRTVPVSELDYIKELLCDKRNCEQAFLSVSKKYLQVLTGLGNTTPAVYTA